MEPDLEYLAGRAIGAMDAFAELLSMADSMASIRLHELQPLAALLSQAVRDAMPDYAPRHAAAANDGAD